jgi:hypothetical protein
MLAGTTAGAWGAATGLGQERTGNARSAGQPAYDLYRKTGFRFSGSCALPRPRKPGLELRRTGESPAGKSRGGTPTGERPLLGGRGRIR